MFNLLEYAFCPRKSNQYQSVQSFVLEIPWGRIPHVNSYSSISGEISNKEAIFHCLYWSFPSNLKRQTSTFSIYVMDEKWSIQPLSVCHCQLGHQRASPCEARGVWRKEVEIFWVSSLPEEEASCQRTAWSEKQERRHSVGVNDAFFITRSSRGSFSLLSSQLAGQIEHGCSEELQ